MGNLDPDEADQAEQRLPRFPKVEERGPVRRPAGPHAHAGEERAAQARTSPTRRSTAAGCGSSRRSPARRWTRPRRGVQAQRPKGLKDLHVGVASVDPKTGALRGFYGGQDYLKSQINWATRAGGSPGSAFKPFALAAGHQRRLLAQEHVRRATRPTPTPTAGTRSSTRDRATATTTARRSTLITATEESINTAFVDMTQAMDDGPKKIMDMAVEMGVPATAPGLEPVAGISLGSAAISPIDMANAYATIANGGRAKNWFVINKVTDRGRRGPLPGPRRRHRRALSRRHRPRRQLRAAAGGQAGHRHERPGAGPARPPARPAPRPTTTATSRRPGSSATPRSSSTAVMYVRGDGNDNLNCKNKNGKNCDARLPRAVLRRGVPHPDLDRRDADVARRRRRSSSSRRRRTSRPRKNDHEPLPTYTPEPDADAEADQEAVADPRRRRRRPRRPRRPHRRRRRPPRRRRRHPTGTCGQIVCTPAAATGTAEGGGGPNDAESLALGR